MPRFLHEGQERDCPHLLVPDWLGLVVKILGESELTLSDGYITNVLHLSQGENY